MSKKNTETTTPAASPAGKPTAKATGSIALEAPTREALAELIDNLPADARYAVGAVGRKHDGSAYTIQVEIIN